MACLYCGKEIGPLRLLRDAEFCTTAHRQSYRALFDKALDRISAASAPPAKPVASAPTRPFPDARQAAPLPQFASSRAAPGPESDTHAVPPAGIPPAAGPLPPPIPALRLPLRSLGPGDPEFQRPAPTVPGAPPPEGPADPNRAAPSTALPAVSEPPETAPEAGPALPPFAPAAPARLALPPAAPPSNPRPQTIPADPARLALPQPGAVPVEWKGRRGAIHPPRFVVAPVFERIEQLAARPERLRRTPTFVEIFSTGAAARLGGRNRLASAGKVVAAGLLVAIGIWIGAGSVRIGQQMAAMAVSPGVDESGERMPPGAAPGLGSVRSLPDPPAPRGAIAQVRRAIRQRAAVELTDSFYRMDAWGASATALPAGWSRNPDSSVRAGQLALYHPSQTFADYRFEFFGEIEKKGLSWAVRARDSQNYYAMKFAIVEPGLRPVIALVHYSVVNGRKGPRVETPLAIMVHNHEPYHVEVDVEGSRVVTSIEGEEVDSWTDGTLKAGGIGFFSEKGELARLYWIRVTRNQDWLGRVCAYLSGGPDVNPGHIGADAASLRPGEMPAAPAQPRPADITLAVDAGAVDAGPCRVRTWNHGRAKLCSP